MSIVLTKAFASRLLTHAFITVGPGQKPEGLSADTEDESVQ
jgi:hypothetical protein